MKRVLYFLSLALLGWPPLHAASWVLSTPGSYVLGNNITFNPASGPDSIILITSNDVTLDLAGRTIEQGNTTANIDGIVINPGLSNITIKNGTIKNCSRVGFKINNGCSLLKSSDLRIDNCAVRGFEAVGMLANPITNFDFVDSVILRCCQGVTGDAALFLQHCSGFRLTNLRVSNHGSTSHNLSAVRIDNCSNARIKDIRANTNTASSELKAFDLSNTTDCIFMNCIARRNNPVATNALSVSYELQASTTCNNNIFINCISFVNTAATSGSTTLGFHVDQNNNDNLFLNCKVLENTSTSDCTGFLIASNMRNMFIDCLTRKNESTSGNARGFFLNACSETKLIRCIASEQKSAGAVGVGFDFNTVTESFCKSSLAVRNMGNISANSFGFRLSPIAPAGNNVFIKNVAMRNGTDLFLLNVNQFNGFAQSQQTVVASDNTNSLTVPWTNIGFQ